MGVWPDKERSMNPQTRKKRHSAVILVEIVDEAHKALDERGRILLGTERMLTDEVIDRYQLGISRGRLTIPILDVQGRVVDIRRWASPANRNEKTQKILHWKEGFGGARLFPLDQLDQDRLVLTEGELDGLALISHKIPAVTVTAGVSTWNDDLSAPLARKTVIIATDNDDAGRKGALKRAESLSRFGCKVSIIQWPDRPKGWDVTDELRENGLESMKQILDSAKPYQGQMVRLSTVQAEQVEFLSYPYLPLAKITTLDGDPGIGKSFISLAIASAVSRGIPPFGLKDED
jgi:hypothetical protein